MADEVVRPVRVPPRWFIRTAWKAHRAMLRVTRGRWGLWTPASKRGWGALRLSTLGRRSGRERAVIVGYLEDGPNLVVLAMNGWGEGEPAWWLNLQSEPGLGSNWPAVGLARCRPTRHGPQNEIGCGTCGAPSSRSLTSTPHSDRRRPQSLSSPRSHAAEPCKGQSRRTMSRSTCG